MIKQLENLCPYKLFCVRWNGRMVRMVQPKHLQLRNHLPIRSQILDTQHQHLLQDGGRCVQWGGDMERERSD